jgi:hypothetical protein
LIVQQHSPCPTSQPLPLFFQDSSSNSNRLQRIHGQPPPNNNTTSSSSSSSSISRSITAASARIHPVSSAAAAAATAPPPAAAAAATAGDLSHSGAVLPQPCLIKPKNSTPMSRQGWRSASHDADTGRRDGGWASPEPRGRGQDSRNVDLQASASPARRVYAVSQRYVAHTFGRLTTCMWWSQDELKGAEAFSTSSCIRMLRAYYDGQHSCANITLHQLNLLTHCFLLFRFHCFLQAILYTGTAGTNWQGRIL